MRAFSIKHDDVKTISSFRNEVVIIIVCYTEPKNVEEALTYEDWILAMEEKLNQFTRNGVWSLMPPPSNQSVIGTRCVFKNKLDKKVSDKK